MSLLRVYSQLIEMILAEQAQTRTAQPWSGAAALTARQRPQGTRARCTKAALGAGAPSVAEIRVRPTVRTWRTGLWRRRHTSR